MPVSEIQKARILWKPAVVYIIIYYGTIYSTNIRCRLYPGYIIFGRDKKKEGDCDITMNMDEFKNILCLMEGKKIIISENKDSDDGVERYNINIDGERFPGISNDIIFALLGFYGIKTFYPNTTFKIPRLWYKNGIFGGLTKDIYIERAQFGRISFNELKYPGFHNDAYKRMDLLTEKMNDIMRGEILGMKRLYFAHPMKTYYPAHPSFEKRCFDIIENKKESKNPMIDIVSREIVNPNSDTYRHKIGDVDDMHSVEEWHGFSWRKFGTSMRHYCELVASCDVLIYTPIFTYNTRKNAKVKWIRKIPRGVKTEISYATKLGMPIFTFVCPEVVDGYILPTRICPTSWDFIRHKKFDMDKIIKIYHSEQAFRYTSTSPFHMYYNKRTGEIHENPDGAGCAGDKDLAVFEPWDDDFWREVEGDKKYA